MPRVPQSAVKTAILGAVLCAAAGIQRVWACSTPPPPPLPQQFANTPQVYLARLIAFKTSPWAGVVNGTIEEATFNVLLTLKGSAPKSGEVKTHTEYWGGNCALSIRKPAEVIDSTGKAVLNPNSDIWILWNSP